MDILWEVLIVACFAGLVSLGVLYIRMQENLDKLWLTSFPFLDNKDDNKVIDSLFREAQRKRRLERSKGSSRGSRKKSVGHKVDFVSPRSNTGAKKVRRIKL